MHKIAKRTPVENLKEYVETSYSMLPPALAHLHNENAIYLEEHDGRITLDEFEYLLAVNDRRLQQFLTVVLGGATNA